MAFLDQVLESLKVTGLLFWMVFWAFNLGYGLSAMIQTLVTREKMTEVLGKRGVRQVAMGGFFGFISSSCSFAALAAARTVYSKGAHAVNAIAFLIASTNLVIELGLILLILIGWKFVLADYLLGIVMIAIMYLIVKPTLSDKLAERGRKHARRLEEEELKHPSPEGMTWREKLTSREGWDVISFKFLGEWKMAIKEVTVGFVLAGFVTVFVPTSFWDSLFLGSGEADPGVLAVLQHALIAPILAFFTFVGSLGNVPLAAVLWTKNMSFAGVLSFLGADLVAATVVYLHSKYYGWAFTAYMSVMLYIVIVASAVIVHYTFTALDLVPEARPASVIEFMNFRVATHTFWLNLVFGLFGASMIYLRWRASQREKADRGLAQ